jgi:hypothetical protein
MPTEQERREHFEQHAKTWEALNIRLSATVEENNIRREDAEKKIAAAQPIAALAQTQLQQIKERRARMERGEGVPPIGLDAELEGSRYHRGPRVAHAYNDFADTRAVRAVFELRSPQHRFAAQRLCGVAALLACRGEEARSPIGAE